jgi:Ca2+-transporting ATPase
MSEEQKARLREIRIFSRVTPEQKLLLIGLHQQAGEVVAMTGDGVNDAPALKKADIGIAMGIRGTQIAREAADLILRDDAFSTITHAISEGRIIYANIRRFATYLLSCNLSEVLVVGIGILAGLPLPLLPLQILFLNLVTDVFPAFALGTIRGDSDILERPPRPPSEPILGYQQWRVIVTHGVMIALLTLLALVIAAHWFALSGNEATTMSFYTLALAQLWHVFNMHNWREGILVNQVTLNGWVWAAIVLCLALIAIASVEPTLASLLQIERLGPDSWATIIALSLVPVAIRIGASFAMRFRSGRLDDAENAL